MTTIVWLKHISIRIDFNFSEIEPHDTDFDAILKPDQRIFMAGQVDVDSWIEESCKFRHKFDFFLRLNRVIVNMRTDRNEEAADKAKQQAIKFETDFMHCEQYNPIESWSSFKTIMDKLSWDFFLLRF